MRRKRKRRIQNQGYYEEDSRILENNFDLKDFITPTSKKL